MAKSKKGAKDTKEEKQEVSTSVIALRKEIKVLVVFVMGIIILLSYANAAGFIGRLLSQFLFGMLGLIAYIVPFFMMGAYAFLMANPGNIKLRNKIICFSIVIVLFAAFMQLFHYGYDSKFQIVKFFGNSAAERSGGGLLGGLLSNALAFLLGKWGAYIVLIALFTVAFMYLTEKFIFAHLGRKSKVAYERVKERAVQAVEERNLAREAEEELEVLEDWEQEEPRRAKFFSFKKDKSEREKEEVKESPALIEIVADESVEESLDSVTEEEEDGLEFLTIQRGNEESNQRDLEQEKPVHDDIEEILAREVERAIKEDIPIYQQEINRKFAKASLAETPTVVVTEPVKETEVYSMQEIFATEPKHEEPLEFACEVESREPKEGIVMDAVEQEGGPLPEDVMLQTESNGQYIMESVLPDAKNEASKVSREGMEAIEVANAPVQKEYEFPTVDLLAKPEKAQEGMSDEELKEKARKLQETLESFGVRAKVINVSCGPAVTRFELQPEQGVKVSKITALTDDIKLNMAAEEIRIEAPIPGKAAVGIEVPNQTTTTVHLRDLVENSQFKKHQSNIAFAVGKDIGGQVVVTDIAKMPHLLIAGATGSGKSVCINTLIMSILYKAHPDDVKLIMIDPKVVELSCYNGIPHLLIPVVTEAKKASAALQWAVDEMTKRYNKFAELTVRDMKGYNEKIKAVEYANDERFQKMPQIVIIVDELADLMMVASKEVEDAICRLAQLARAAGIHLVIATQRPSVNVITGLIKANVPSRIAFAVSSAVDSRTILDGGGAEKLLGKGDMLFYPSGFPKPVRVQGAFVSDEEVNTVVEFITQQNIAQYDTEIDAKITENKYAKEEEKSGSNSGNDDYFVEAGKFIIEKEKASIGMLQRVYKIGFNRAARIMDQLCAAGVVGPEEGTKPRKILMTMEEFENYISQ